MNSLRKFGRRRSDQKDGDEEGDNDSQTNESDLTICTPNEKTSIVSHRRCSEPLTASSLHSRPSLISTRHESIPEDSDQVARIGRNLSKSAEPLGLSLVHEDSDPVADFIFVHGLGGSSYRSWSWNHDPDYFWPIWLKHDVHLSRSRIFTFGYNADFIKHQAPLNVLDFAKDLLFRLKTYASIKTPEAYSIGRYPIVFVMHSLGGLVVKKACIIGRSDFQYTSIVDRVVGMLFLGTPHRGSDFAETLNNILRSTPGFSPRAFVTELTKGSESLQGINEQFRTVCSGIELISLYETRKTSLLLGIRKLLVEKESAILGYPTEHSGGLDADHHNLSKFVDPTDTNFVHVRNVLNMVLQKLKPNASPTITDKTKEHASAIATKRRLEDLLGIYEDPADDLHNVQDRIMPGSCRWILDRKSFQAWADLRTPKSQILWLTGRPGIGKSALSGFIIKHLQKNIPTSYCHYHFFTPDDQKKRTIGHMLRSIALQLANSCEPFRDRLLKLYYDTGISFGKQKLNAIWEAIYETILFRQKFSQPIFWVIDGLDEADHPELLMRLLSKVDSSNVFRVIIVSRMIRDLTNHLSKNIDFVREEITSSDTLDDIRHYASSGISNIVHTKEAQEELCNKIFAKAHGSFLWVKLALEQLRDNWHTYSDVDRILNDMPEGMEQLYCRMIAIISQQASRPKSISSRILTWMVCAFRPLEMAELETVLESEFGGFVSLQDTVSQTCANFVVVEKSRVVLIHETARHFLLHNPAALSITVDGHSGHEYLATTCIRFLMDPKRNWRRTLAMAQAKKHSPPSILESRAMSLSETHPFLTYAVLWWPYHVSHAVTSEVLMALVFEFLESTCLIWINAVGLLGEMRDLVQAGQYLRLFLRRKRREFSHGSLMSLYQSRDDEWRQWVKDLIRVVGRFSNILMQNPQSIYSHVIPFCPKESIIRRTFERENILSVSGISSDSWDDCMARLTMGNDEFAIKIICLDSYFVTLVGSGTVIVWHSDSCTEARRIQQDEWVTVLEACRGIHLVATAGTKTIRGWDVTSGEEVFRIPKTSSRRILALSFGKHNDELRIGYDDSTIQCYSLDILTEKWSILAEDSSNHDHTCPYLISFSPTGSHVLLGYRGKPIVSWGLDAQLQTSQKHVRPEDRFGRYQDSQKAATPECVEWLPDRPTVLILYVDTTLVEWNIEDDSNRELPVFGAREMTISSDGNLLLTSENTGALSIWAVPEFRLTYRLKMEETVRGLAFSPDGQRFFDIRGLYCNVWEPDALVRPDDLDQDELSSTQNTNLSEPVSSTSEIRAQITNLIGDNENEFYCCGKDSGAVVLYEIKTGEKVRKLYGHSKVASITQLAWSRSRTFIASADDCGRVLVKRLRPPSIQNPSWAVYGLLDFRPGESVKQLLFDSSEENLLVATSTSDSIWSLKNRKQVCQSRSRTGTCSKWMNHPSQPGTLVLLDLHEVRNFRFASLEERYGSKERAQEDEAFGKEGGFNTEISSHLRKIELCKSASDCDTPEILGRIIAVDESRTIFEVAPSTGTDEKTIAQRRVMLLDLSHTDKHTLQPIPALTGKYNRIIGTFQNHLVFLDRDYAFCTLNLDIVCGLHSDALKRHVCLPKDWLSPEMLDLCTMNQFGTILCPKNGEIAVIQGGVREQ